MLSVYMCLMYLSGGSTVCLRFVVFVFVLCVFVLCPSEQRGQTQCCLEVICVCYVSCQRGSD